jgi:hypothetical protein
LTVEARLALRQQEFSDGRLFQMSKMIVGVAAAAMAAAATVVWSKSMFVQPQGAAPAAKAEHASVVSSGVNLTDGKSHALTGGADAEHARGSAVASDSEYGWGPFRTVDW